MHDAQDVDPTRNRSIKHKIISESADGPLSDAGQRRKTTLPLPSDVWNRADTLKRALRSIEKPRGGFGVVVTDERGALDEIEYGSRPS